MFLNFQTFSVYFLRPKAKIQILMYRNLDFLFEALIVVGALCVSALMSLFFVKK